MSELKSFHIGVDLGQRVDHTAVVVVEQRVVATAERDAVTYEYRRERKLVVCLVERLRLGVGYEGVARELERLTNARALDGETVTTVVDATGLGMVVSENLRRKQLRGELYPVVITGGQEGRYRSGYWPTPRAELLLGVERALEVEGLGVAAGVKGWSEMEAEMRGMRKVRGERGPRWETLGAHDDLVFALGLALFGARMRWLPVEGESVRWRTWGGAWPRG
ncbi:MAG: hypothetical protein K7J46_14155 [Bryobacter sp.]|nr:hypothetical protein [Bryobacter sp. CoA8 C33]